MEADPRVEALEFRAVVDEAELHFSEAGAAAMIFDSGHELCAESGLLARRVDGDETEMGALAARLDVRTGDELAVFFEEQEFPAAENFAKRIGVDALAFDVGAFGDKSGVDEPDEGGDVVETRVASNEHAGIVASRLNRTSALHRNGQKKQVLRFPQDDKP
jgi:hypothetical protein